MLGFLEKQADAFVKQTGFFEIQRVPGLWHYDQAARGNDALEVQARIQAMVVFVADNDQCRR